MLVYLKHGINLHQRHSFSNRAPALISRADIKLWRISQDFFFYYDYYYHISIIVSNFDFAIKFTESLTDEFEDNCFFIKSVSFFRLL